MLKFSKCFKMTHLKLNSIYWKVHYLEVCNLMHDIVYTKSLFVYQKTYPMLYIEIDTDIQERTKFFSFFIRGQQYTELNR